MLDVVVVVLLGILLLERRERLERRPSHVGAATEKSQCVDQQAV
jgi:hypothetical protein